MEARIQELCDEAARLRLEGREAEARPLLVEAVALCRRDTEPDRLGRVVARLGQIERDLGNAEAALLHYGEAAGLARTQGDMLALAHRLRHIGDIHMDVGRTALAEPFYDQSLAIYRSRDDVPAGELANAIRSIALLRDAQGYGTAASALWQEAEALYAEAGVAEGVAESRRRRR